jgi:hypothetical protein
MILKGLIRRYSWPEGEAEATGDTGAVETYLPVTDLQVHVLVDHIHTTDAEAIPVLGAALGMIETEMVFHASGAARDQDTATSLQHTQLTALGAAILMAASEEANGASQAQFDRFIRQTWT